MFSSCPWQEDSLWGGVLWLRGWRRRRPQKLGQLQETQASQDRRRERRRREGEERWGGNKRYLFISFILIPLHALFLCPSSYLFRIGSSHNTDAVSRGRLLIRYFITEVKEEEKVPEEEKMDTSKWENSAHTYWPCCGGGDWLGQLIISLLWIL